eukprot:Sspe_Gene.66077::Locus_39059_Transcript_1_1_Confidence_1.000_Length_1972::g.66077::m.66077/K00624/E2.3.1.7; carnitine O-acetyltransferase
MAYPGSKIGAGGSKPPPSLSNPPAPVQTWHIPKPEKPMWRCQGQLPRLPVPKLEDTLKMYLDSIRPLTTDAEFERTKQAVEDFRANLGPELQKRLVQRAKEKGDSSWLIDWWNELSYFGYRDPVVVYVSYFYQFRPDTWSGMNQVFRAAGIIKSALGFRQLVATGQLPVEMSGKTPQDMSMYNYLFNAARIPHPGKDYYATYDATYYKHIVVLRKGRLFKVETEVNGDPLTVPELCQQLERIKRIADTHAEYPLGILTAENRDKWAAARKGIVETSPHNKSALELIDSSAFVLCLDDGRPDDRNSKARAIWHGCGRNRWFDKPLQFIVAENGEAGLCGEHGIMDGTPTNACADWVLTMLAKGAVPLREDKGKRYLASPAEITFDLTSSSQNAIRDAERAFDDLVGKHDMVVVDFTKFGKDTIKKYRVSPDAFCQMAIQLAYKRLTGSFGATYESCSTRGFLHGRTETIRSCHIPGSQFVEAMDSPNASAAARYDLLQKAAKHQSWYAKQAVQGQGCDRHLMGLKLLCKDGEAPAIFSDPVYSRSSSWLLSTSTLSSEHYATWGFGEVVPEGFGVGYMVNKGNLAFTVASLRTLAPGCNDMAKALERALLDMQAVCEEAARKQAKM